MKRLFSSIAGALMVLGLVAIPSTANSANTGVDVIPSQNVHAISNTSTLTTSNLAASSNYTSSWVDTTQGQKFIAVSVYADQNGSFIVQYTDDTSEIPFSTSTYTVVGGTPFNSGVIYIPSRYWRINYNNGGTATTKFKVVETASQVAANLLRVYGTSPVVATYNPSTLSATISCPQCARLDVADTFQGALTAPSFTANAAAGGAQFNIGSTPVLYEAPDAVSTSLRPYGAGYIYFYNNTGTTAWGYVNGSGFNTGSSNYGASSATVNGKMTSSGALINTVGAGSANQTLAIYDTTVGAPNPYKYIRVSNGNLQITNNAFTAVPFTLSDSGNLTLTGSLTSAGASISSTSIFTGPVLVESGITNNGTSNVGSLDVNNGDIHVSRNGVNAGANGYVFFGPYGNYFGLNGSDQFVWYGNNASTQLMWLAANGSSLTLSQNGSYLTGSSTYGATSATVNGNITSHGAVSAAGDLYSTHNIFGAGPATFSMAGGTSGAGLGWNGTGSGATTIYNGYKHSSSGGTSPNTEFFYWDGTQYQLASLIEENGTYTAGSSTYGPTSASINGPLTVGTISLSGGISNGLATISTDTNSTVYLTTPKAASQNNPFTYQFTNSNYSGFNVKNGADVVVTGLAAPSAPTLGQAAGGTLAATTYYVKITYHNGYGQTTGSTESSLAVSANNVLTVTSPVASGNASGWDVYVGTSTGSETLQSSGIAIGTNWTEPTTGLVSGSALPTDNASIGGLTAGNSNYRGHYATVEGPIYLTALTGSGTSSNYISGFGSDILMIQTSDTSGQVYFRAGGNYIGTLNSSGYTIGSSVFGPTSATINGPLTTTNLDLPLQVSLAHPATNHAIIGTDSNGYLTFRAYNINGFQFQNDQGTPTTWASLNSSGWHLGSTTYGSTSASVNGNISIPDGTSASTLLLGNSGTATSGANYNSQTLKFDNSNWNGSAAVTNSWTIYMGGGSGAGLNFAYNGTMLDSIGNNGTINIGSGGTSISSTTATFNGLVTANGFTSNGNINLNITGTATSSSNYPSDVLQWNDSTWNGSAAVTNNWTETATSGDNFNLNHNGTTAFQISNGNNIFLPVASAVLQIGSAGTADGDAISIANGQAANSKLTQIGVGTSSVSGVQNNLLGFADQGRAWLVSIDQNGSIGAAGNFYTGSSIYGATSATINGSASATNYTASVSGYFSLGPTNINGSTALQQGGAAVSGISATSLAINDVGAGNRAALDTSGNLGLLGSLYTGSSTYGPTSAAVNGMVTAISPNNGTTGGVAIRDASGNPNAAYLQFTNNAESAQYGYIRGLSSNGLDLNGNATINSSGVTVGSSIYGPTSAVVNGNITATQFINPNVGTNTSVNNAINLPTTFSSGTISSNIGTDAAATVSAVAGQFFSVEASNGAKLLALDGGGNLGIAGTFKAGSSSYGATSATVNGLLTAQGISNNGYFISTNSTGNTQLKIFADSGGQNWIESGNNGFTANQTLNLAGYNANQGNLLNLNFATTDVMGALAVGGNFTPASGYSAEIRSSGSIGAEALKISATNGNNSDQATIRLVGQRVDGNGSSTFSGTIGLAHLETDSSVVNGVRIGRIAFGANGGGTAESNLVWGGQIAGVTEGQWSNTSSPFALAFYVGTTPFAALNTSNAEPGYEAMRLTSTGNLNLEALSAPSTPTLGQSAGGTIAATTYYVKVTYVNANGETTASGEASLAVSANNVLTVTSPAAFGNVTSYNVYVSTATGTETKQANAAIGTNWTEPTTGLVAGAALPTVNSALGSFIVGSTTISSMNAQFGGCVSVSGAGGTKVCGDGTNTSLNAASTGAIYFENTTTGILGTIGNGKQFNAANGFVAGSSTYGPTSATVNGNLTLSPAGSTIYVNGTYMIGSDGASTILRPQTSAGHFSFQNTSGAEKASIDQNGNINANAYATGSSNYGATSATVNGTMTATTFSGSGSGLSAGTVPIAALAADTISGVVLGNNLNALTIGTHLTGGSYNGSGAVTIATDATNANTASTIVARDASGNFSAGTGTFAGDVISLHNIYGSGPGTWFLSGGTSGAALGWNGNGDGSATIYDGYANPTHTASFYYWNGTAYTLSSSISPNGAYNTGSSAYGPTSATISGSLSVTGQSFFVSPNSGSSGAAVIKDAAGNPNAAYLQFTNNAASAQYGYIRGLSANGLDLNGNATLTSSGLSVTSGPVVAPGYSGGALEAGTHGTAGVPIFEQSGTSVVVGCDGTAQNCPVAFYTAGTGSGAQASISNTGALATSTLSITAGATGVGANVNINGDITSERNGATGVIFLGNAGTHYVFFDGSNYQMPNGAVYATAFVNNSRAALKHDIHSLQGLDALGVLHDCAWSSFRYKSGPQDVHYGFIADRCNSLLSGPKRDHFDAETTSTFASLAVLQEDAKVKKLQAQVDSLKKEVTTLQAKHYTVRGRGHSIFWYLVHPWVAIGS